MIGMNVFITTNIIVAHLRINYIIFLGRNMNGIWQNNFTFIFPLLSLIRLCTVLIFKPFIHHYIAVLYLMSLPFFAISIGTALAYHCALSIFYFIRGDSLLKVHHRMPTISVFSVLLILCIMTSVWCDAIFFQVLQSVWVKTVPAIFQDLHYLLTLLLICRETVQGTHVCNVMKYM